MELLFWSQRNLENNIMGHPVSHLILLPRKNSSPVHYFLWQLCFPLCPSARALISLIIEVIFVCLAGDRISVFGIHPSSTSKLDLGSSNPKMHRSRFEPKKGCTPKWMRHRARDECRQGFWSSAGKPGRTQNRLQMSLITLNLVF